MGAPRGDANVTRQVILAAARDLFAQHGVDGVSVRQIAAAAGINHALVHRYFGTKDEMVAAIMLREARALTEMARPEADPETSLASMMEAFTYLSGEGRTSMLLMLRAELDGLAPERIFDEEPLRPLRLLAGWVEQNRAPGAPPLDPRVAAMIVGSVLFGLTAVQPLLAAGVGLDGEPPEDVLRSCLQGVLALVAAAVGAPPGSAAGTAVEDVE